MGAPRLAPESYRPIYLWAGPGTVRMNRLKFMDAAVDEAVHLEAHLPAGAGRVLDELDCNWVHLMYDWGFPDEIEQEDWESFRQAAGVYHDRRASVFAYIQTSNCVFSGSFRQQDWYACDPAGRKQHYYSGRYMTCPTHPGWRAHLRQLAAGALERGADGIFFDNLWYGVQPLGLFGAWLGGAGCYCPRCRALYRQQSGRDIPAVIDPEQPETAHYLRWRAHQMTSLLAELAGFVRQIKPGAPVSANDYDAVTRNSLVIYGIDLPALARVQDIVMIENFALPRWDERPRSRLANNALTIRTARELVAGQAHLSVLSYDVGIGFDPVYPARRYRQGLAETAACGAGMTVKGTEYWDGQKHTLLTAPEYAGVRQAIGDFNHWLAANPVFGEPGENLAPVGLLYPGEALWRSGARLARLYFGAGQALTAAGIPWRVVLPEAAAQTGGLQALLTFGQEPPHLPGSPVVTDVLSLPGWALGRPSLAARSPRLRAALAWAAGGLLRAYHDSRPARRVMDALGMVRLVTRTPLFTLPPPEMRAALLEALPQGLAPRLHCPRPALIEAWRRSGQVQVHLVNYAQQPQRVQVSFDRPVRGTIHTPPGGAEAEFSGAEVELELDVYKILVLVVSSV